MNLAIASSLTDQRVLVTGGGGYVGSALVRALHGAGVEVHATSRRTEPPAGVDGTWHRCDLSSEQDTDELVARVEPDVIYHLAGAVTGVRDVDQVVSVFSSTLASTVHVLAAAQRHATRRVVLASSMEEPEGEPAVPTSPYAAAKWASGGYGRMFATLYDLEVVELRVFMVYGPGRQPVAKLVPTVALSLLRGERPELGSGQRRIDWVYIDDVVAALARAATADVPVGVRPDVGSGSAHSIREFVGRLARHVGPDARVEFGARGDRAAEVEQVADLSIARDLLDWAPTVDLDTGLERVVTWYRHELARGAFDDRPR